MPKQAIWCHKGHVEVGRSSANAWKYLIDPMCFFDIPAPPWGCPWPTITPTKLVGLFIIPYTAYGCKALVSFGCGNIHTPYCQDENLTLLVSVRMSYGHLWSCTTVVESTKSILFMPDNDEVGTYSFNAASITAHSRWRWCFIIMRTQFVSSFRLECW